MAKDSKKSGIPVFGEVINLLNKQEINKIAEELKSDKYTKRLDSYQHLVIMLYAAFGQFNSLRELELRFLSSVPQALANRDAVQKMRQKSNGSRS